MEHSDLHWRLSLRRRQRSKRSSRFVFAASLVGKCNACAKRIGQVNGESDD
jgi:hypothetical protein